jgi:hypothetical protein
LIHASPLPLRERARERGEHQTRERSEHIHSKLITKNSKLFFNSRTYHQHG